MKQKIAELLGGYEPPPEVKAEVEKLVTALAELVCVSSLSVWFQSPNKAFGGLKPMELIERGEIQKLWEMVCRMKSGLPA